MFNNSYMCVGMNVSKMFSRTMLVTVLFFITLLPLSAFSAAPGSDVQDQRKSLAAAATATMSTASGQQTGSAQMLDKDKKILGPATANMPTASGQQYTATGTIAITSPVGGQQWEPGTTHAINWSYSGYPGKHVKITLYGSGRQFSRSITSSVSLGAKGQGTINWTIPNNMHQSTDSYVQIESLEQPNIRTVSNRFDISGRLNVTHFLPAKGFPYGHYEWNRSHPNRIKVKSYGNAAQHVRVKLFQKDSVSPFLVLYTSLPITNAETGTNFDVTIPTSVPVGDYFIRIYSVEHPWITDKTEDFRLIPGIL